jgi:hypothetical protein
MFAIAVDDRDQNECLRRISVAAANSLHVRDRRRRGAEPKATLAGDQYRRLVIRAHDAEGNERRKQHDANGLEDQNHDHRQRQRRELP